MYVAPVAAAALLLLLKLEWIGYPQHLTKVAHPLARLNRRSSARALGVPIAASPQSARLGVTGTIRPLCGSAVRQRASTHTHTQVIQLILGFVLA